MAAQFGLVDEDVPARLDLRQKVALARQVLVNLAAHKCEAIVPLEVDAVVFVLGDLRPPVDERASLSVPAQATRGGHAVSTRWARGGHAVCDALCAAWCAVLTPWPPVHPTARGSRFSPCRGSSSSPSFPRRCPSSRSPTSCSASRFPS